MSHAAPAVHGLGRELVAPDWAPVLEEEARAVLARYGWSGAADATVLWRSPRPLSAAAIVRCPAGDVLLKRHDARVRAAAGLLVEHGLAAHLSGAGIPVPAVLATEEGTTALVLGDGVYELHELADGTDLYRDAPSWTGYRSLAHAREAGGMLARFHRAAAGFSAPPRPSGPLVDLCALAGAQDPVAAVAALAEERPGLAFGLRGHPWREDLGSAVMPFASAAASVLATLPQGWGHGDWHPSNLTWSGEGPEARVAGVLDLGLANRTTPAWDLAIAIERACIDWLALTDPGSDGVARADLAMADALIDGYEAERPLSREERAGLPVLLPVVHLGLAVSEIEYYADVLGSPARAEIAYRDYLIGHAHWFGSAEGKALLKRLGQRAQAEPRASPRWTLG